MKAWEFAGGCLPLVLMLAGRRVQGGMLGHAQGSAQMFPGKCWLEQEW